MVDKIQLQIKGDDGCIRFKCKNCDKRYYLFTKEMWKLLNHKIMYVYANEHGVKPLKV